MMGIFLSDYDLLVGNGIVFFPDLFDVLRREVCTDT